MQLKFYPDMGKTRVVGQDLLSGVWIVAWAWAGWKVWQKIEGAAVVADKIKGAGEGINQALAGMSGITGALASLPGVGDLLRLPVVGQPGDGLIALSESVRSDIAGVALGVGLLVALPPILYVLLTYVKNRWGRIKEMGNAAYFVQGAALRGQNESAKALLAYRALARLSFSELMAVSEDPIGDIQARNYDGLAKEMLKEAGLDWRRLEGKSLSGAKVKQLAAKNDEV